MDHVVRELALVGETTTVASVASLLSDASDAMCRTRLSAPLYSSLLRAAADRVAPFISNRALPPNSDACVSFDHLFLRGIDHVAFDILASRLRQDAAGGEVLARTAALFVLDGERRLASVISHAAHDGDSCERLASALIHLPSRIANVAFGTSNAVDVPLLDQAKHARTLAMAIIAQPHGRDAARDALLSSLLGGLARLRCAADVVSAMYESTTSGSRVAESCLLAPEQHVSLFFRAVLELPASAGSFAHQAAVEMLRMSATVRFAATRPLEFTSPLLERPRVSAARLVRALREALDDESYIDAMREASEVWGGKLYADHQHALNQQQLTRIVLLHFTAAQAIQGDLLSDFSMRLAEGVSHRLDHGDERVRRFGMVVGEAFSRLNKDHKPLKFPREKAKFNAKEGNNEADGGDSDFSELAEGVVNDFKGSDSEDEQRFVEEIEELESRAGRGSNRKARTKGGRPTCWEFDGAESFPKEDWELEDDWTSLETWSQSESDEDEVITKRLDATRTDFENLRKKIDAPMSIPRLLSMLRTANSGTDASYDIDAELMKSMLRTIAIRAKGSAHGDSFHAGVVDLCRAAVLVDPSRYPDEDFEVLDACRNDVVHSLSVLDIAKVGELLITDFAVGKQSDLKRRSEALRFLIEGAREVSERGTPAMEEAADGNSVPLVEGAGTVTRRSERSLTMRGKPQVTMRKKNEFTQCAAHLFFLLVNGLQFPAEASILKPFAETDANFYSQVLASLASLLSLAGEACLERRDMARGLTQLAFRAAGHADPSVRRAAALAAGTAAEATTASDLAESWRGEDQVVISSNGLVEGPTDGMLDWLVRARDDDVDVLVRRFASIALAKWTEKAQAISSGQQINM